MGLVMCLHATVRKITDNPKLVVFRCAHCQSFIEVPR